MSDRSMGWWGAMMCLTGAGTMAAHAVAGAFPDAHDAAPVDWKGPVFHLKQNYPTEKPVEQKYPWQAIDFKTEPLKYLLAVRYYCYEGNVEVEWDVNRNKKRQWYHAPWLHYSAEGREFIHGLTKERPARPGDMHPNQKTPFQAWAVSIYNEPAGYVIGQVWHDPQKPDPTTARFPEGAVSFKLLFSQATVDEVPYLKDSVEWQAHIHKTSKPDERERTVQTVRLLQMDMAVRDRRADGTTGWVFGTYAYDASAPGKTAWERMVPVGLMWGNDPGVTPTMRNHGAGLAESWINIEYPRKLPLGWAGRLNGPADNPQSSCLSCHMTAQWLPAKNFVPPKTASEQERLNWFRNLKPDEPFDTGRQSLDYSLSLTKGIANFEAELRTREKPRGPVEPIHVISRDEDDSGKTETAADK